MYNRLVMDGQGSRRNSIGKIIKIYSIILLYTNTTDKNTIDDKLTISSNIPINSVKFSNLQKFQINFSDIVFSLPDVKCLFIFQQDLLLFIGFSEPYLT